MSQRQNTNRRKAWAPLIAACLVYLSLAAVAAPVTFDSQWIVDAGLCISAGDVQVCEESFTSQEMSAVGSLHLIADQDSPLFGKTSRAEKQIQFERTFSAEGSTKVALFAELTGSLRIEGGDGEVVVRAAAIVLDAATYLPVAGMKIDSTTASGQFDRMIDEPGILPIQDSGVQVATLPAGTYVVLGSIEATAEMGKGWWNHEAEVDVSLSIEFLAGTDESATPEVDPESLDQTDFIVIPLGVEGTSYSHLEPGVRGGTFYASAISEPKGWNAVTSHENSTSQYTSIMMRGLVDIDPTTSSIVPELARSWELAEDGLEILFHLRRGLKWSDGEPFTADDVLFTFNDLYYNLDIDTDTRDILRLPDDTFPEFEKIDDYTLRVTLSVPFRPILNSIGANIMPEHVLANSVHKLNPDVPAGTFNSMWTLDTNPSELVGMGPFMLESYFPGQGVTLRRNPYYYHVDPNGVQLPYLDRYVILTVENQDVSLLKFRNQELDAFGTRALDLPILNEEAELKDFTVLVKPDVPVFGTSWIGINQDYGLAEGTNENLRTLFRDLRFRKAVAHSVDKETIIRNVYSELAVPQWSPVSYLSPFYAGRSHYGGPVTEESAVVYEFDPEKTVALFDEIGIVDRDDDGWRDFEDGTPIEIEFNTNPNTTRESICLIVTQDLQNAGLNVTFQPIDFNTLVDRLTSSTIQMVLLGLGGSSEPNSGANVYRSTGGLHFWHYSADAGDAYDIELLIDELMSAGVSTFDNDAAFETYKQFQIAYAENDLGLIFTVNPAFTYAYYNRIGNGNVANPIATPSGGNGLTMDLIYLKSP
ncbi:ABC transporter substrate-binding protein [Candidatus Bipolaricaulota bacterium]